MHDDGDEHMHEHADTGYDYKYDVASPTMAAMGMMMPSITKCITRATRENDDFEGYDYNLVAITRVSRF